MLQPQGIDRWNEYFLQSFCQQHGLKTSGTTSELKERVRSACHQDAALYVLDAEIAEMRRASIVSLHLDKYVTYAYAPATQVLGS